MNIQYIQQGKRSTPFIASLLKIVHDFVDSASGPFSWWGERRERFLITNRRGAANRPAQRYMHIAQFTMRRAKLFTGISVSRADVFITYISVFPPDCFLKPPRKMMIKC